MQTTTLNLRDIPADVAYQAKVQAAVRGQSLKDYICDLIRGAERKRKKK